MIPNIVLIALGLLVLVFLVGLICVFVTQPDALNVVQGGGMKHDHYHSARIAYERRREQRLRVTEAVVAIVLLAVLGVAILGGDFVGAIR